MQEDDLKNFFYFIILWTASSYKHFKEGWPQIVLLCFDFDINWQLLQAIPEQYAIV